MSDPPAHPEPPRSPILRRTDQACAAVLVAASLAVIAAYWVKELGRQDDLLRVQRDPPPIDFLVDVNSAPWTELSLLPGVGETLAKRIVESRAADGPFREHDDVLRVRGIGPKTLERMRPYLTPMPDFDSVAGP